MQPLSHASTSGKIYLKRNYDITVVVKGGDQYIQISWIKLNCPL
jgi:hypothetical protein